MAKDKSPNKPKGKIRVFLFELEGSDETLLESVKSIAGAVNRTFNNNPTLQIASNRILPPTKDQEDESSMIEGLQEHPSVEDEIDESADSQPKNKRARRYRNPKILDIDLGLGEVTFKEYFEQKKPSNDIQRYLVIADWLKSNLQIDEISADHIYTCYRSVKLNAPKDIGQGFRNAKRDGLFNKGSDDGLWKINHVGEGRVLDMGRK